MTLMTVDPAMSLYHTDKYLLAQGLEREELHEFWLQHTPEGQEADDSGGYGAWFTDAIDDDGFFYKVIQDLQRFLFSDPADPDLDVPEQPAEAEEIDGVFDAAEHMRMLTYQEFVDDRFSDLLVDRIPEMKPNDFLVVSGQRIPVEGEVYIVSMDEPGGLDIAAKCKRSKGKPKGFSRWPKPLLDLAGKHSKYARLLACVHWDAGWSAAGSDKDGDGLGDGGGAFGMLIRRGLGTCMGIDRPRKSDGRVIGYQWLDPGLYYGWHGSAANPRCGMSFDLSNAVYAKYAKKYIDLCGIARPLLKISDRAEKVGSGKFFMGHYRDQILTMLRVLKAFAAYTKLPLMWPVKDDGTAKGRQVKDIFKSDYHGVMEHRHLPSTSKWDCRGLDAQIRVLLLKDAGLLAEFPSLAESMRLHDEGWAKWLDKVEANWKWAELGIGQ